MTELVPGTTAEHTSCLLLKMGQVLFRIAEDRLAELGLRLRHYSILQALADNGSMSQLALGGYLRIDPATMVSSLDDLEAQGLATRERDAQDRRRYVIHITDSGADVLAKANAKLVELDETAFTDLSDSARARLHGSLGKLNQGATLRAAFDNLR